MAEELLQYEANLLQGISQRRAADKVGTPRGTLLRWQERSVNIPMPKSTIAFFESLDGIAFLERRMNALQFVRSIKKVQHTFIAPSQINC